MAQHDSYHLMISLALDGVLSDEEEQELTQHMRGCAACADMWTRMIAFDRLMHEQVEAFPPINFVANVMRRVETYEARRRLTPWMIAILATLSVLGGLWVAAPVLFFALGLDQRVAEWPVVAAALSFGVDAIAAITRVGTLALDVLLDWLFFVTGSPAALAVVVAALVLASTYIGLRESFRVAGAESLARA